MKGLTSLGGLAKGLKGGLSLAKTGLKGVSMGVKGLGKAARAGGRQMKKLFTCGDPIDVATGEMVMSATDVTLPGVLPLTLERHHRTSYRGGRWFGRSWASTLDQRLLLDEHGARYTAEDGMVLHYPVPGNETPVHAVEGPRWPLGWDSTGRGTLSIRQPETGRTLHFRPLPGRPQAELPLVAITDRNHNTITVVYDEGGCPAEVFHDGGYHIGLETTQGRITGMSLMSDSDRPVLIRYEYDSRGNLAEIYNSSGLPLRYFHDTYGRIVGWRDRNDFWYRYEFDGDDRCISTSGVDGILAYTYEYNREQNITRVTNSLDCTYVYQFNGEYQLISETDPLGFATQYSWDRYDNSLEVVDPLGRVTAYSYDTNGDLTGVTRPNGSSAAIFYSSSRLPIRERQFDGTEWLRKFDDSGLLVSSTDPLGGVTEYSYGARGNVSRVTDPLGGVQSIEVDEAGLPTVLRDADGAVMSCTRDSFGRVVSTLDPLGNATEYQWTLEGKISRRIFPDGATESWSYDGDGNLVEHVDSNGGRTQFSAAPFDLPASRITPDGSETIFEYDTELRLVAVTNSAGQRWTYQYDAAGRLTSEDDYDGRVLSYAYDAAGQLISRKNGAGQVTHFVRDLLGNVVEQRCEDSVTVMAYSTAGRLEYAENSVSELRFEYDDLGRTTLETCNGRRVERGYDAIGRLISRRHEGERSKFSYSPTGLLTELTTSEHCMTFDYDAAGHETTRAFGSGAKLAQSWDVRHRLTGQHIIGPNAGAEPAVRRTYGYARGSWPVEISDTHIGDRRFATDATGRITAVSAQDWSERYSYDSAGNTTSASWDEGRESFSSAAGATGARSYEGSRIIRAGRVSFEYDGQGRVTRQVRRKLSGGTRSWQYFWDGKDQLVRVEAPGGHVWHYVYDPLGRRIGKRHEWNGELVEDKDFRWDGSSLIAESTTCAGQDETTHTYWEWQPNSPRVLTQTETTSMRDAPQHVIDSRFHAIVTDLSGTPTELVDEGGAVTWRSRRTAWGLDYAAREDAPYCPLVFPGQYRDEETGLHYNLYRYYDPHTGRYLSTDPLGLAPSPNHYSYVSNPFSWIDPFGLSPCPVLVLGIHDPCEKLAKAIEGAVTFNHPRFAQVVGDGPFGPIAQWQSEVTAMLRNNSKVAVALDEFKHADVGDFAKAYESAFKAGAPTALPRATEWEMHQLGRHVMRGNLEWSNVTFYHKGSPVTVAEPNWDSLMGIG
ncbi:DUF6531 domain-containing protein [Streptomyces sp. NPDC048845]|uniref:DUF6531 domain-containing protein n=1 Tax=Streptomyces sp. NPDC048845 TaxID=3155390 RepID=UPI00342BCCEA